MPEQEESSWDRIRSSLRRPSRGQAIAGVLLAALGFAAVTQVQATRASDTYAGYREQDLIDLLNGLSAASQRSRDEIAKLEAVQAGLQDSTSRREAALTQARQLAESLSILAGQTPVTGSGIVVTVTGGAVTIDALLDTIEELRTAGSEAMELNGQRLTAPSYLQDGANGLVVDGQPVSAPYTLRAIGDPDALSAAMRFNDGPIEQLQAQGAQVAVTTSDQVQILSTTSPGSTQFLQPQ